MSPNPKYRRVTLLQYLDTLRGAQRESTLIADATTHADDLTLYVADRAYLTEGGLSGYVVRDTGELVGVFSRVRGQGDTLVRSAIYHGATHLDCFDGYLPTLYGRHGFTETHREGNWTPGGPDVVYMTLDREPTADYLPGEL